MCGGALVTLQEVSTGISHIRLARYSYEMLCGHRSEFISYCATASNSDRTEDENYPFIVVVIEENYLAN